MTPEKPATRVRLLFSGSRWSLGAAVFMLAVCLTASAYLYRELSQAESAAVTRYVENLASYMESDLLDDLFDQVNAQRRMATRLAGYGIDDVTVWETNSRLYLEHFPFYRQLAVLEPDLTVRWVEASNGAIVEPGQHYPMDEVYLLRAREVAESGELLVMRPFYLSDGKPALSFLMPIGRADAHQGFIAAVLVVPDSVEAMVSALFREFIELRVVSRDQELYPYPPGSWPEDMQWDAGFLVDVDEDGSGFLFEFALTDSHRSQITTNLPMVVLVSGSMVSLLFAVIVLLGLNAITQARVLAASNRRLEAEVSDREEAERRLAYLVNHDDLTGLANRAGSTEFLRHLIARTAQSGQEKKEQLALMFLDLDQFKDINDSLGHRLGDQLLCEIPRRLDSVLRESDYMGRYGGDEFLIAVIRESREQVEELARNILRALDGGFAVRQHRLFVSASIGIAYYPESGSTAGELIQNADTALFKAKHAGRNQFAVFTREMFIQTEHRVNLSRDMRQAIEDGDFRLVYQPIVSLDDLSLCGVEALLRWRHRDGYDVSPQEFIRVAEETGIIGRLGQFVLDQALEDLSRWQRMVDQPPWLAVNISGAQIQEAGFAEQLSVLLHQHNLQPQMLHLEITEEVLIENFLSNRQMLRKLDEIGMRIAVDDFGIGYSSLAYLKNFPVSVIKIDRSFVRDLSTDGEDQAITRAICSLSEELGMGTVAEGVENREQLDLLRRYRCSYAQGFLFSRPVAAEQADAIILGQRPWADLDNDDQRE